MGKDFSFSYLFSFFSGRNKKLIWNDLRLKQDWVVKWMSTSIIPCSLFSPHKTTMKRRKIPIERALLREFPAFLSHSLTQPAAEVRARERESGKLCNFPLDNYWEEKSASMIIIDSLSLNGFDDNVLLLLTNELTLWSCMPPSSSSSSSFSWKLIFTFSNLLEAQWADFDKLSLNYKAINHF